MRDPETRLFPTHRRRSYALPRVPPIATAVPHGIDLSTYRRNKNAQMHRDNMYYTRHIILASLFRREGNDNLRCAGKTRVSGGAPEALRERREREGGREDKNASRKIRPSLCIVRMQDVCGAIRIVFANSRSRRPLLYRCHLLPVTFTSFTESPS